MPFPNTANTLPKPTQPVLPNRAHAYTYLVFTCAPSCSHHWPLPLSLAFSLSLSLLSLLHITIQRSHITPSPPHHTHRHTHTEATRNLGAVLPVLCKKRPASCMVAWPPSQPVRPAWDALPSRLPPFPPVLLSVVSRRYSFAAVGGSSGSSSSSSTRVCVREGWRLCPGRAESGGDDDLSTHTALRGWLDIGYSTYVAKGGYLFASGSRARGGW